MNRPAERHTGSTPNPDDPRPRPGVVTVVIAGFSVATSLAWWSGANMDALVLLEDRLLREPWRLLTAAVLHLGAAHLVFNLLCFWPMGSIAERSLGPLRFIALLTLLAVTSGAAEYATGSSGVGLSGIVYGLWTFAYFAQTARPEFRPIVTPRGNQMMVTWFFICIALTWLGIVNVANTAHAAGAAIGALAGRATAGTAKPRPDHARWIAILGLAVLAIAAAATYARPYLSLLSPPRPPAMHAAALLQSGRYAEAAPLLEHALTLDPANPELWRVLVAVRIELGEFENALDALYRATQANTGLRDSLADQAIALHINLAEEAERSADYAEAFKQAQAAAEWNRSDGVLLLTAGSYAESAGDRDAAARYATAALADPRTRDHASEALDRLAR